MNSQGIGDNLIVQVGLVVRDIEQSAEKFSQIFGVPKPPIRITDEQDKARTTFNGMPTPARARLAFFHMGQVAIELIEPAGGPSTWQKFLDEKGEGVHHIAFRVKGTDQVVSSLVSQGIGIEQQGYYPGGMYTYMNSAPALGVILELLENF